MQPIAIPATFRGIDYDRPKDGFPLDAELGNMKAGKGPPGKVAVAVGRGAVAE